MSKKALIGLILIIFTFGLIQIVTSYTSAEVYNEATLRIVRSADALIAVPDECNLGEVIQGDGIRNINITNNLAQAIDIWVDGNVGVELGRTWVPSGSTVVSFFIIDTLTIGENVVPIVFEAETTSNGVQAEINSIVKYTVVPRPEETAAVEDEITEQSESLDTQPSLNLILIEEVD